MIGPTKLLKKFEAQQTELARLKERLRELSERLSSSPPVRREDLEVTLRIIKQLLGGGAPTPCYQDRLSLNRIKAALEGKL